MGIDVWVSRQAKPAAPRAESPEPTVAEVAAAGGVSAYEFPELEATIRACTLCGLHESRTQAVCGVGNQTADWMIIGEAPGQDEDLAGEPFVGRAGQLLNEMLRAAGMAREDVYIANILKCRPPNNRDPQADEVNSCMPYLQRQIELVRPKLILLVGRIAAQNLLGTSTPVGKLRGKVHSIGTAGIPAVVTYHPAYLLRSPAQKRKSWDDLCLAMDVASGRNGAAVA
jgi:DNA polymerase